MDSRNHDMLINSLQTSQDFLENFGGIPAETLRTFSRILAELRIKAKLAEFRGIFSEISVDFLEKP